MRKLSAILLIQLAVPIWAWASHITGGEMFYTYGGLNGGLHRYNVTLKLYQRCNSGRQFPNPTTISVFDKTNGIRVLDISATISTQETISITTPDPCITNPPNVCYEVAYYSFTINLPSTAAGYVLASQVNYRINGINNLQPGYNNIGAMYTAEIPGHANAGGAPVNSSAFFTGSDLVVVCANNDMRYSFAAFDPDGDQLRYTFCSAYASTGGSGGNPGPPDPPPFPQVPYNTPSFNLNQPLGQAVQIHPSTGMITGIAPDVGIYVVTVCVQEIRAGRVIATQRKDIQINVADCDVAAASLEPEYLLCKNSLTINLSNQSSSPLIVSTYWEFLDESNAIIYRSNDPLVTYTFPVAGLYKVRLVINRNQTCSDSTEAIIRAFPGFTPGFNYAGICLSFPTRFTDETVSVYGVPDSWDWNFGEPSDFLAGSEDQHPAYTYPLMGTKQVRLIVTDTRGCRDTLYKTVTVLDKPPIQLAFRDTLICLNDALTLQAQGMGTYNWTPVVNMINPASANPTVRPLQTTRYYVTLTESNCVNTDSVLVRVVNEVSLQAMNDTTICQGDTIRLRIQSNGLQYQWTPAGQIINPQVQNPLVFTQNNTLYQVTARIGGCNATQSIRVNPIPYPVVQAGADQTICYNALTTLQGSTDAGNWTWQPASLLNNNQLLQPLADPDQTTDFILTATDNRGCPKPVSDTVRVQVEPAIRLLVTNDTSVVEGQPLQLQALGAAVYQWSPPDFLSSAVIPDPVAVFRSESTGFSYKIVGTNVAGCKDSTRITIKVFKTGPSVFVPTAFTPNNDGRNDQLFPVAVGMKKIDYFRIYNRWGQLVFSTQRNGDGWDGRINGQLQTTSTYVWTVSAVDYNGNRYFQKGLTTLIQ